MGVPSSGRTRGIGLREWLGRRRVVVINVLLVLAVSYGALGELLRGRVLDGEIARLEAEAKAMDEQNAALRTRLAADASDAVLEREARLKLNLRRPGEEVVVVRGVGDAAAGPATRSAEPFQRTPNAVLWWRHFFR